MQCHQLLSRAESNDAAHWIVGRDAHRHAVTGDNLDAKAPHPAAQLCEHLVAGIALHAIQTPGVHRHYGSLHVDEIIFAQQLILSPNSSNECATRITLGATSNERFSLQ